MIKIQLMSRGNVESDLMKLQIIIKNELNNDIMVNRFITKVSQVNKYQLACL